MSDATDSPKPPAGTTPQTAAESDSAAPTRATHLMGLTDAAEIAQWIALAAISGVIGNEAHELLKGFKKRFGRSKVREVESIVEVELETKERLMADGSTEVIQTARARSREFFREFD